MLSPMFVGLLLQAAAPAEFGADEVRSAVR